MSIGGTHLVAALTVGALSLVPVGANAANDPSLGTPMPFSAGHTVSINDATLILRVEHFDTLRINNAKGQGFSWRFDTFYVPTAFPLSRIAPTEFTAGETWVYVHPPRTVPSD